MATTSDRFRRDDAVARLVDGDFDLLVVGGGITGTGVALDAATRGLSVALVERDDFASGTSSKSSKLIHGGLRYLQQGDVRLVYEALRERRRLQHNAPHLVNVLPFMIPILTRDGVISRKIARALGSAMWMYDLTGGWRIGRLHRRLRAKAACAHLPTMPRERLSAAYLYFDAEADDARLCLAVARSAADRGAVLANGCRLVALAPNPDGSQRATVRDEIDGREFALTARRVVNAAGVWSDEVRALDEAAHPDSIRPAKGVHITVPWEKVRNDIAVVIPVPGDKRSLFVVPWIADGKGGFRYTYVGTTDTDYRGPIDEPQCTKDDIDYVLRALNASVTTGITADDVTAVWAGLRPLVKPAEGSTLSTRTADLSRRHRVSTSARGVITVTGGKLTTYREMAEDTVDEVLASLGRKARCRTRRLRLHGADGSAGKHVDQSKLPSTADAGLARHLAGRHGSDADAVVALIDADPALARPMVEGLPYVMAEVVHAVVHEMANTLDDVLSRRTRARLLDRRAAVSAAPAVAGVMAPLLGWDADRAASEVRSFVDSCARESAAGSVDEVEFVASLRPADGPATS